MILSTFLALFCDTGDAMSRHSGEPFTTKDRDNDGCISGHSCIHNGKTNCALMYYGGWWYDWCHSANLNGRYLHGYTSEKAIGVVWLEWTGYHFSLITSEMKLRPTQIP